MTIKVRFLCKKLKDHYSWRDASEYVYDKRDLVNGQPPGWFLPNIHQAKSSDEVEFDHKPTLQELQQALGPLEKS